MIIGICGGTGSGKTTLARKVAERIGEKNVILIEQDSYYQNLADMPLDERRQANFDHPEAVDFDSIAEHLADLKSGKSVEMPIYDFKTHTRSAETRTVEPKPVVLVEGILIFSDPRVAELLDVKIYIDTPDDIRLVRRIRRDVQERGRTVEQTLSQWEKTIRPMHNKFVEPSKNLADVIFPEGGKIDESLEFLFGVVRGKMKDKKIFATQ